MTFSPRRIFSFCPASLAFAATVALGYFSAFWEGAIDPTSPRGASCLLLGAAYSLLGTIDYIHVRDTLSGWAKALYFCVQGGLLVGILLTSHLAAQMFFCVLPMVAVAVTLFGTAMSAILVAGLFGMSIAVNGHFHGTGSLVSFAASTLPAYGFVMMFTRIALKEKAARARAESLSAEVERLAVIQERNRLAREIHDSLGHYLTTIHVQLEAARAIHQEDPARALEAVGKAQDLSREALVEVRRSVGALRADCAPVPLASRLRELAAATDGWGAAVSLEILGLPRVLAPDADHALFRVAQEGLTNVRRHAHAKSARVLLDYRDTAHVHLRVTDDGRGAVAGSTGSGLAGLRERVVALGGRVAAENQPGGGFRLDMEIPA